MTSAEAELTVSVVVPTLDRPVRAAAVVGAVLAGDEAPLEVLVVDQSADDGTERAIRALGDGRVRRLSHPRPRPRPPETPAHTRPAGTTWRFSTTTSSSRRPGSPPSAPSSAVSSEPNHERFWPSGPSAAEYVPLLRAGDEAAKTADPGATVVLGGLSKSDFYDLEDVYRAGGGAYFDAVAVHPYTYGVDPTAAWNGVHDWEDPQRISINASRRSRRSGARWWPSATPASSSG